VDTASAKDTLIAEFFVFKIDVLLRVVSMTFATAYTSIINLL